jgi:ADP-dependent NAD(P)H-hydrate dehydratase / NAD(P)H-hydrate epimerase
LLRVLIVSPLAITPHRAWPLSTIATTRALEQRLAATLPPHTLMQRAGLATARLALALEPHAQQFWIACGPGNNGGDGLEAAMHLHRWGKVVVVTWLGNAASAPADARASHARAREAGVTFVDIPPTLTPRDCAIDALLGIGGQRTPEGALADCIAQLNAHTGTVLAVDLPSGLHADTGNTAGPCVRATHTLSLLTLKPGLYTALGRDHAGHIWLDTLSDPEDHERSATSRSTEPTASTSPLWLLGAPSPYERLHASHKGSYGDIAIVGGAPGMSGAAVLAASAALHHGAGRVYTALLDAAAPSWVASHPELMVRAVNSLPLAQLTVVAGCGGGDAIARELPKILSTVPRLVLDADGLNAVAQDPMLRTQLKQRAARGYATVLTPHPLEAARLLGCDTTEVQHDRIQAAQTLAQQLQACVVLKGSGTVVTSPDQATAINPTGNGRLATGGTGDVLAGVIGARMAAGESAYTAACAGVWLHGHCADTWPAHEALTAGELAKRIPHAA